MRKIKCILQFTIERNSTKLNTKIITILGQRRLISAEFLDLFIDKVSELDIDDNINLPLKVIFILYPLNEYVLFVKLPGMSNLFNHFYNISKNFDCPGYFYNKMDNDECFNYILTPYILYEILKYRMFYENENIYLYSIFRKNVSAPRGKGINLYIC